MLLGRFMAAPEHGDLDALEDVLAADVVHYSDGGGKVRSAPRSWAGTAGPLLPGPAPPARGDRRAAHRGERPARGVVPLRPAGGGARPGRPRRRDPRADERAQPRQAALPARPARRPGGTATAWSSGRAGAPHALPCAARCSGCRRPIASSPTGGGPRSPTTTCGGAYAEPASTTAPGTGCPCPVTGARRPRSPRATARCRTAAGSRAAAPARARRAWLTFDGLFYQGDVWLDGGYLGDTEGYFSLTRSRSATSCATGPSTWWRSRSPARPRGRRPGARSRARSTTATTSTRPETYRRHLAARAPDRDGPGAHRHPARGVQRGQPERAVLTLRAVLDSDAPRRVRLRTEVGALDHEADQPLATGTNEVNWSVTVDRPALWPAPSARPCCTTCVSPWCSPAKAEATTTPAWR